MPLLDSIAPVRSRRGRPRHRPAKLHADKAYDQPALRAEVRRRGIAVRIARRGVDTSQRLGRHRWIVESCLAWLLRNRRLVRRYHRKPEHPGSGHADAPRQPYGLVGPVQLQPYTPVRIG